MKDFRILSFLVLYVAATAARGKVLGALRHRKLVELSNCAADCQTLPLIVGFQDACETASCQTNVMQSVGIATTNFRHLTGVGMMFIDSISDSELELLQANKNIKYIECDSCSVGLADDPICGSDGKSYKNEDELSCGLKCRGTDSSVSISYRGKCGSATQSVQDNDELLSLGNCPTDGAPKFPLIVSFKRDCDVACAAQVMLTANIEESKYTHLVNLNMITLNNDVSDVELASLRRDTKNINSIECDSEVSIEDGENPSIGIGIGIVDEANINSELCPSKHPILGAAPPICDSAALTSDCKYSPGPCMLDPNETCYSILCSCFNNELVCAQDSDSGGGQDGGLIGIGIEDEDEQLVSLDNCPAEPRYPLIIVFKEDCNVACATQVMQTANIDETKYTHLTNLNMITLYNDVTGVELASLLGASKNIESIECDSEVSIEEEDGTSVGIGIGIGIVDGEEVLLEKCPDDGSLTLPLLITFQETCDAACASRTMQKNNIDKTKFDHFTNVNIISLKEVTSEELTALQGEASTVKTIECDGVVSMDDNNEGPSIGIVGEDDTLIDLESCDDGFQMPLLVTFHKKCTSDCALATMEKVGITPDKFEEKMGIFILNEASENQVLALRGEKKEILAIECDASVGISDDLLIGVDSCKDGIQMPLLVTFAEKCGTVCALGTMEGADINTNQFEQLSAGIFRLNEATDGQLLALRGEKQNIAAMECDGIVSIDLITVDLCDDGTKMPLLVTFKDSCHSGPCMLETMKKANIDESKFDRLGLGIIILKEVTDDELTALRGESDSISTMECDADAQIADGGDDLVSVTLCEDDKMKMPLLLSFSEACDKACQLEMMKRANIDENKFGQTGLGIVMLKEVTDEQLLALRKEKESIVAIECDVEGSISNVEGSISKASSTESPYEMIWLLSFGYYCIFNSAV